MTLPRRVVVALATTALTTTALATACSGATDTTVTSPSPTTSAPPATAQVDPDATALPAPAGAPAAPEGAEGAEGYEGPGTDTVPPAQQPEGGEVYEGPGTDTVPPAQQSEGGEGYEGPGTDTVPPAQQGGGDTAPAYSSEVPSTYRVTGVTPGDVVAAHADPDPGGARVGSFPSDGVDITSTGRVATTGDQLWREVEVPGGTVGWVNARFLEVQGPAS